MKIEDLTKLGVAEDIAKQVVALSEQELAAEKGKLTDKEAELTMANDKINELTETVKKFDGVDVEKLKADLEAANKKYDEDTAALKLDSALTAALADSGAIDKDIVKGLIDRSIVKLEDGKLVGVAEQLEKLKTDKAFLFGSKPAEQQPDGTKMTVQLGTQFGNPASGSGEVSLGSALAEHYKV